MGSGCLPKHGGITGQLWTGFGSSWSVSILTKSMSNGSIKLEEFTYFKVLVTSTCFPVTKCFRVLPIFKLDGCCQPRCYKSSANCKV